eukprot:SAG11_NODE_10109_length_854_cov_1.654305_1_plen_118_part_00
MTGGCDEGCAVYGATKLLPRAPPRAAQKRCTARDCALWAASLVLVAREGRRVQLTASAAVWLRPAAVMAELQHGGTNQTIPGFERSVAPPAPPLPPALRGPTSRPPGCPPPRRAPEN